MKPAQTDAKRIRRLIRKAAASRGWGVHTFHHAGRLFSLRLGQGLGGDVIILSFAGDERGRSNEFDTEAPSVEEVRQACDHLLVDEILTL